MKRLTHVYALQELIYKGGASQDARWNNSFLGHILDSIRASLLKLEIKKKSDLSEYYDYRCMKMIHVSALECGVESMCTISRSEDKLPVSIDGYQVLYIDRTKISKGSINLLRNEKYSLIKKNEPYWFIFNNYLYIVNIDIKNVVLRFLAESPEEAEESNECDCDCSNTYIPVHLTPILYDKAISLILKNNQTRQDNLNNRKDDSIQ